MRFRLRRWRLGVLLDHAPRARPHHRRAVQGRVLERYGARRGHADRGRALPFDRRQQPAGAAGGERAGAGCQLVRRGIRTGRKPADAVRWVMTESITGAALISSQEIVDLDAFTIGSLYRRSRVSLVESTKLLIEAGQRLAAKKAQLDHGQWLPWLETNADILGFETRMTASRLMKAARKCNVNDTFNEENAILLNRTIWGNEEPEPIEQFPAITGPEGVCCGYDELHALVRRGVRFGNIYADPPWLYGNQGTRAATSNHYAGLTVDQLCDPNLFPISKLAADDAHLHLWTTNGFLLECPRIFEAWGFEFKSSFVWTKPQMGIGNYWRK